MDDNTNKPSDTNPLVQDMLSKMQGLAAAYLVDGLVPEDCGLEEHKQLELRTVLDWLNPKTLALATIADKATGDEVNFSQMYSAALDGVICLLEDLIKISSLQIFINASDKMDKKVATELLRTHAETIAAARESLHHFSKSIDQFEETTHLRTAHLADEIKKGAS